MLPSPPRRSIRKIEGNGRRNQNRPQRVREVAISTAPSRCSLVQSYLHDFFQARIIAALKTELRRLDHLLPRHPRPYKSVPIALSQLADKLALCAAVPVTERMKGVQLAQEISEAAHEFIEG